MWCKNWNESVIIILLVLCANCLPIHFVLHRNNYVLVTLVQQTLLRKDLHCLIREKSYGVRSWVTAMGDTNSSDATVLSYPYLNPSSPFSLDIYQLLIQIVNCFVVIVYSFNTNYSSLPYTIDVKSVDPKNKKR